MRTPPGIQSHVLPLNALHALTKQPVPVRHRAELLDVGIEAQERADQEQAVTRRVEDAVLHADGRDLHRLLDRMKVMWIIHPVLQYRLRSEEHTSELQS